jgi:hypothetical protein
LIEWVKVLRKIWRREVYLQVTSPILDVHICSRSWYFCPEQSWCAREGGRPGKRKTEEVKQKGYKGILEKGI